MVRSPPPPAIHPPLASTPAIEEGTPKNSDLPLRNYTSPLPTTTTTTSQAVSPNQAKLPPTPPDDRAGILPDGSRLCASPTPSSTVAEFGDRVFFANRSAVSLVEHVGRSYVRTRSRSETSDAQSQSRSNTPTPRGNVTATAAAAGNHTGRSQSSSNHRQTTSRDKGIKTNEKVNRFLHCLTHTPPPQESQTELLSENRSLQQRISALQRTETDLLEQTQKLSRQLESMKKQYDVRIREWKDEVREGKKKLQDRIKELESEVVAKDERLREAGAHEEPVLSDDEIMTWFAERTAAWHVWTEEFGHRDPKRLHTGLHPLQLRELCDGVKGFVRLTDGDKLPDELLNGIGDGKARAAHVLLYGMLSHFIIYEALQSPFWVFAAFSGSVLELESPIVPRNNSMSPVGFRMDLAMWSNIATLGSDRLPQPTAARRGATAQLHQVGSIKHRLSLATSMQSLSLDTANLTSLPKPSLPGRQDMENLYNVLSKVQNYDQDAHNWRRHLMRTLSQGGLALDADKAKSPDGRLLVEARETYAKKLKERFLSGPARYLLEDQDALGIEKLERRLLRELDLALRISCQVWSRSDELRFSSLSEFSATEFHATSPIMELCEIQAPGTSQPHCLAVDDPAPDAPPASYDGNAVVMVVQPAVESIKANDTNARAEPDAGPHDSHRKRVWAKAQVLVRTPIIPSVTTTSPTKPSTTTIATVGSLAAAAPGTKIRTADQVVVPQTTTTTAGQGSPAPAAWTVPVPLSAPVSMPAHTPGPGTTTKSSSSSSELAQSSPVPPGSTPSKRSALSPPLVPPKISSSSPTSPPERRFKVTMLEVGTR